ncbi:MAG: PQQ-like beta-propeller repeat protein [Planctomyces sp.]|nr:PQQ-like beta-propeller repeat protein [Planctomyces sp.]
MPAAALFRRLVPLALLLAVVREAPAGDWPQWLGPRRNGVSEEIVAPWETPPEAAWRKTIGSGFSSPVVAHGLVFVHAGVAERDDREVVLAFDAVTGEVKWSDEHDRPRYRSDLGNGPRATPLVVEGRLYTFGISGVLSCYDAVSGDRQWQINPYDALQATRPGFGVCSSPVVVENRVIVPLGGAGSAVAAFDANTGELAWKELDEPAGTASPVVLRRGAGDSQRAEVVVQTTLRLLGLNPADGSILWEHPLVFQPSGVSPTPLTIGDFLVSSTQDTGSLALELPTGGEPAPHLKWWNQDLGSYFSTGTVDGRGGVLLITNAQMPLPRADLHSVDLATGETRWTQKGLGYFHLSLIRTGDGKVLLLDDGGNLVLASIAGDRFEVLSKAKVCRGTFVNPAFANGRLYARDASELVCVPLPPGETAAPSSVELEAESR